MSSPARSEQKAWPAVLPQSDSTHRADGWTPDGVALSVPHALIAETLSGAGASDLHAGDYGVAMMFLPADISLRAYALETVMDAVIESRLTIIGRREVPVRPEMLGATSMVSCPHAAQILVRRPVGLPADAFEQAMHLLRGRIECGMTGLGMTDEDVRILSCSSRMVVYGMAGLPGDPAAFYPDLTDPRLEVAPMQLRHDHVTDITRRWKQA